MMNERELIKAMTETGYQPGAPSATAEKMDRRVCSESECHTCGGELRYWPYTRGSSYRAFAYCPECDHATEF